MTTDNGMDVSPSWQELKAERDEAFAKGKRVFEDLRRVESERNALAAHVEKLNSKLADIKDSLYGQNLYIAGWHLNGDTEPMDAWFEENDWEPEPGDCTSLARRKAEWQAEALDQLLPAICDVADRAEVRNLRDELRRQAEEATHD